MMPILPLKLLQEDATTATAGRAPLNLNHSTNLAPPEENGSPGSATPPADTGGDPCPSCFSSPAPPLSSPGTVAVGTAAAVDSSLPCRCGDKAQGGHTGGEPVAAADAVGVEPVGGGGGIVDSSGGIGRGYVGQQTTTMVATDSSGGGGGGAEREAQAATVVGMTTTTPLVPLQQYVDPRHASSVVASNQQPAVDHATPMMVVDVRNSAAFHGGQGAATPSREIGPAGSGSGGGGGGGGEPWSVFSQQQPALVTPRESEPPVVSDLSGVGGGAMQQRRRDVGALQVEIDTMDRLAQSLAQAQQLALSVEARQTELLGRPKRRSHPSAKQVRPSIRSDPIRQVAGTWRERERERSLRVIGVLIPCVFFLYVWYFIRLSVRVMRTLSIVYLALGDSRVFSWVTRCSESGSVEPCLA